MFATLRPWFPPPRDGSLFESQRLRAARFSEDEIRRILWLRWLVRTGRITTSG